MICALCDAAWAKPERLDLHKPQEKGVLIHDSFAALQKSNDGGCPLCILLLAKLFEAIDNDTSKFGRKLVTESTFFKIFIGIKSMEMQTNHQRGSSLLQVKVELKSRFGKRNLTLYKAGHVRGSIGVCLDRSSKNKTLGGRINGRLIAEDPVSPEAMALVNQWIEECDAEHAACKVEFAQRSLPSRTIDVGPADGSQDPRLVLHLDKSMPNTLRWVALSHRWGDTAPLKTTTSNISAHQTRIPFEQLPDTFRDAVIFTRKLGIRHLWIDSLCICQDDPADWRSEYPNMGSIYECSYLTLIADVASDCGAGFLDPTPRNVETFATIPWSSDSSECIYLTRALRPWNRVLNEKHSYIHSRGWCLQEDLLSPRSLHFGTDQMFFECRSHRRAESLMRPLQNSTDLNLTAGKSFVRTGSDLTSKNKRLVNDPDLLVYAEWAVVVNDYTRRQLTFPEDKLPALVGAAKAFQRRLFTDFNGYHAGLWENNLHKDLLWRARFGESLTPVNGRAPSWSWASVDGVVVFPRHLGPAFDGYLAKFHRDDDSPFVSPEHVDEHVSHPLRLTTMCISASQYDHVSAEIPPGYGDYGLSLSSDEERLHPLTAYFDSRNEETQRMMHSQEGLLFAAISVFSENRLRMETIGLLLQDIDNAECFRRVGTVKINWTREEPDSDAMRRGSKHVLRGWTERTIRMC